MNPLQHLIKDIDAVDATRLDQSIGELLRNLREAADGDQHAVRCAANWCYAAAAQLKTVADEIDAAGRSMTGAQAKLLCAGMAAATNDNDWLEPKIETDRRDFIRCNACGSVTLDRECDWTEEPGHHDRSGRMGDTAPERSWTCPMELCRCKHAEHEIDGDVRVCDACGEPIDDGDEWNHHVGICTR